MVTASFFGSSIPGFFLSLLLVYIFNVTLGILPSGGMVTLGTSGGAGDVAAHMVMPVLVLSVSMAGTNIRYIRSAVLEIGQEWKKKGFVDEEFLSYISDEEKIAFPWSMIDKITPRPADSVAAALEQAGVEQMKPVITSKKTYIAPFVNAEGPQYLVIEDRFPNGRPQLEKAGVYMTDRDTVNKVERMKVTTCLNPLHTALAVYGCILGI